MPALVANALVSTLCSQRVPPSVIVSGCDLVIAEIAGAIAKPDAVITWEHVNGAVAVSQRVTLFAIAVKSREKIFVFAFGGKEMISPRSRLVPWIRDDALERFVGAP